MSLTAGKLVSGAELAAHLDDRSWLVVDCRHDLADVGAGEAAYRRAHIPGAHFLHLDRDLSGPRTGANGRHPLPAVEAFARTMGVLGIDDERQVVAYDQNSGMWAARLWFLLQWLGHDRVAVLDGGLDRWLAEGRPTSDAMPVAQAGQFRTAGPLATASADEILRQMKQATLTVVDARAPERYRGEVEPIDRVAGHIPGAINRPYVQNLDATGIFKRPAQLRAEFVALLGDRSPQSVVHQCGSGVTACHNLLAMAVAGMEGSRLYPGSWSEWCADPGRPVARG